MVEKYEKGIKAIIRLSVQGYGWELERRENVGENY